MDVSLQSRCQLDQVYDTIISKGNVHTSTDLTAGEVYIDNLCFIILCAMIYFV
jgi:hypothetical protein